MRIRTRLLLVLAVPTLLLIAGMATQAASHLRARSAAAETSRQATLVLAVQNLVHALQRERTLLTALHAGDGRVRADLTTARLATDRSHAALSQLLAAPDATGVPYASVRRALARLPTLDRARTTAPALPLAPETPAVPGGPPRAQRSTYGPETPMIGPFGAPVTPAPAPGQPSTSASAGTETVRADAAGRQEARPAADGKGATGGGPATDRGPTDRGPVVRREVFQAFTDAITELTDGSLTGSPTPDGSFAGSLWPDGWPDGWPAGSLWPDGFFAGSLSPDGVLPGTPVPGPFTETAGLGDPALTRPARALEAISRAKEAAARERAVVTAAYVTGGFRPSEYVAFLEARASLADSLAAYRRVAAPAGAAELSRAQRSPQAARTARLERRALAAPPGTPLAVRPRTWLVASGAYVNALHSVQRSAGQELLARAAAVRERHTRHLMLLTGAGAVILLVMAALGTLLARSILRPLRRLTGEATALARHVAILEAEPRHPAAVGAAEPGSAHPAHLWRAYNASFRPAAASLRGRRDRDGLGHEAGRLQARGHLVSRSHRRDGERRFDSVLGAPTDSDPADTPPSSRSPHPPPQDGLDTHETPDAALRDGPGPAHEGPHGPDAGRETPDGPGAGPGPARADGGAHRGEFGQLAGALMDLHEAAVRIAASRAEIRQDAAASLEGLGMRHRDLVHRQLTFISVLQRNESDPAVLARLCELDRLTSRLRRNSESLLVLTGTRGRRRSSEPVPVDEVLRAVLAEVEDHQRVALRVAGRAYVRGPVVAEVAHMLAELLDNALCYSASDAEVNVVSRALDSECRIMISDQGVGMTAAELATANARLRGEQSFLVTPTRCLGHHVVGRLAERLGVRVSLHKSPGGGVTALVALPEELLAVRPAQLLKDSR
ncbi:nitrate- and nitrite sensing domain-containing protein [Nonomuraea sp. MCN248]|uniref:histidine kinase n=1 Tax=Nonomuraea corallina TaxID=2989783 RepID=A0ABT4SBT1_9ACTN|nr:nitrate- and nitrite sensing domain-containing protein [Nonomuraea corallina]MDA0634673.1 nitrate- and nitrite sensing domain-containing protein [Nonomuraea corallina]